jgi:6-phosphogluconolactonase
MESCDNAMSVGIRVYSDGPSLARAAAEVFVSCAQEAVAARGRFGVMLSGGNTPRAVHGLLAQPDMIGHVNWQHSDIFWGDERCVPPDSADSNYRMARETLLHAIAIPAGNVHRIQGEAEPASAALQYERTLREYCGEAEADCFDLVFLGMGDDGHTASLFPYSEALKETQRWVLAAPHTTPPPPLVPRITLTPVALKRARRIAFLVSGESKAERAAEVLRGQSDPLRLPAQLIIAGAREVLWLTDQSAARLLGQSLPN